MLVSIQQFCQAAVGEAGAFQQAQFVAIKLGQRAPGKRSFQFNQHLNLVEKPGVNLGNSIDFCQAHPNTECIADIPDALGAGRHQLSFDFFTVSRLGIEAVDADLQPAQGFL